jgi:uncharacterized protein YPO0396
MSFEADAGTDRIAKSGLRLQRIEVLDWGPFERVGVLALNGGTALLTGNRVTGPSSWADAITTLLGFGDCDRTRDPAEPSIALAVFDDAARDETVTLAQVSWSATGGTRTSRSYVWAERDLSIADHFVSAGGEREPLLAVLRGLGAQVEDTFAPYGAWIRRRFGVRDGYAWPALRTLASMSAPGDLDSVVRRHVLEPFDLAAHLAGLMSAYEQASHAYGDLTQTRAAAERLGAVLADVERYRGAERTAAMLDACLEHLPRHFAQIRLGLLDQRLACMQSIWEQLSAQIERLEHRLEERRRQAGDLRIALAQNGGDRLERLSAEIRRLVGMRDLRRAKAERYGDLLRRLGEEPPADEAQFHAQRRRLQTLHDEARERDTYLAHALPGYGLRLERVRDELDALPADIEALRARVRQLELRLVAITQLIEREQGERKVLGERLEVLARLEECSGFDELDWATAAGEIADRIEEREQLQSGSDVLRLLGQQVQHLEQEIARSSHELDTAKDRRSKIEQRTHEAQALRQKIESRLGRNDVAGGASSSPALDEQLTALRREVSGGGEPSLDTCDAIEQDTRAALVRAMQVAEDERKGMVQAAEQSMAAFQAAYPQLCRGLATVDAAAQNAELLARLRAQEIPSLDEALRKRVQGRLRDELASLHAALAHARANVREQIARINRTLAGIEHAPGRHLVLEAMPSADDGLQSFQTELRAWADGTALAALGAEASFERIGALVEPLLPRSREGDEPRRRIAAALDARHAFCYRAVEVSRQADGEAAASKADLSDPQRVCTVLAAELHRRLGLDTAAAGGRSMRFAVLGLAFTTGSDEHVRFALQLLHRLGIQLLVLAPLAKVPVAEPFVDTVAFVHETDGAAATLHTLTIEAQP